MRNSVLNCIADFSRSVAETLKAIGIKCIWAENIYAVRLGTRLGFEVCGGFGLNVTNSVAANEYARLGVKSVTASIELPAGEIASMKSVIPLGVTVYGHLPLMRFRACPARKASGCAGCNGKPSIADRYGTNFTLVCHDKRFISLLNPVPLDVCDRRFLGADFRLGYFTVEPIEKCREVLSRMISGEKNEENHTTGMYYSKLL